MQDRARAANRPIVAFGPETPGWGSWDWVGADLEGELANSFSTSRFGWEEVPRADVLVVVKHPLPEAIWKRLSPACRIVYCPVDFYGSAAEIDSHSAWLGRCSKILVHCERLRRYFSCYAAVDYLDHHVKYVTAPQAGPPREGPILWTGVHSNLGPLVNWVNSHSLPRDLLVLTNWDSGGAAISPATLGFESRSRVQVERWSPERHLQALSEAAAALDIKGTDFRSRHKPPTKALDFVASGLPLALEPESSAGEHLARLGFDVCSPTDIERWFSEEYRKETQRFGAAVREMLSLPRIAYRLRRSIEEVWELDTARPRPMNRELQPA
jgi:hypothetical protein